MFLLRRGVEEEAVAHQGAAQRASRLEATEAQAAGGRRIGEGLTRVDPLVLQEGENVAVPIVRAGLGDDVDRSSCGTAEFSRKPIVDDLELAHDLGGARRARSAYSLVRVVQPVNGDRIAARSKASEGEPAVG